MVLRILIPILIVLGAGLGRAGSARAEAIFLELDGYYRLRSTYFYHLFPENQPEENTGFLIQRLRLEPVVVAEERVRVHTQVDVLDDMVWGNNQRPGCRDDVPAGSGTVAGRSGEESDTLVVKRAWAEIRSPYGSFLLGRQPWEWGLAAFLNSGDGLRLEFGDRRYGETRTRLAYRSPPIAFLGNIELMLAYDKLIEDPYNSNREAEGWLGWISEPTDDFDEWILTVSREGKSWAGGLGISRQIQNQTRTKVWVFDPYGRVSLGPLYLEGEGRFTKGETRPDDESEDIKQIGGLLRLGARLGTGEHSFDFGLEGGFASGDESGEGWDTTCFAPDYRLDLLLFTEVIDYLTRELDSPRLPRGGVTNAFYLHPFFRYSYPRWVSVIAGLLWARPDAVDGILADEDSRLGIELDTGAELRLTRKTSAGLELGYLFSGEGLSQDFGNPFVLRGKFQVEF